MNSIEYLAFLRRRFAETNKEVLELLRDKRMSWALIRSVQLDDPKYLETAQQIAEGDTGELLTRYVNQYILPYLQHSLPEEIHDRLGKIPIAVLPIRSVNASAIKSPNGDPLIIIDTGIFTMAHFYLEMKPMVYAISQARGLKASEAYMLEMYQFVLQYYEEKGTMDFPYPKTDVKIPEGHLYTALAQAMAIETFVIGHEIGHIYAGHLDVGQAKSLFIDSDEKVTAEFYQLSWNQEYEADALGWKWYQQSWSSNPFLKGLSSVLGKSAPLFLFEYMALIETNIPNAQNKYSSHPPAKYRIANLIKQMYDKSEDNDIINFAIEEAQIILTMPKVNNKGRTLDEIEKYNEAIEAYDKAIQIDPNIAKAWYNKGVALYRLGKYNEAIKCYDKAIHLDPNDVGALTTKGLALVDLGKYDEAITYYDKAIQINPDSLDIKTALAEALLISKNYSKSEHLAKEVIDRTDDKILVYIMRLLIVCSLYMRGSTAEGRKEILDLLNYFESIPTDSEDDWSFDNLKEMINYASGLSKNEKEILYLLTSLPKTKTADYRLKYVNEIRNLTGK